MAKTEPDAQRDDPMTQLRHRLAGGARSVSIPGCLRTSLLTHALTPGALTVLAGAPGAGKGFFAARICYERHLQGQPVYCLPLEDDRATFLQRALAVAANSWRVMEGDVAGREGRERLLEPHAENLRAFSGHVAENPRLMVQLKKGKLEVPPLPPEEILKRVREAAQPGSLVLVDPLSQIDFAHYREQESFVRGFLALLASRRCMAIVVAHLTKISSRSHPSYEIADLQGAAGIGRLCHTALVLASHDRRRGWVYQENGGMAEMEYDKTLHIVKARQGRGHGLKIALRSRPTSPLLDEQGILVPETKVEELQLKSARPGGLVSFSLAPPAAGQGGAHGA